MHLVPALCPQCGGALDVDPNQEAAVCKFCGTPFITEKAIQNYNITNVTNNVTNVTNNVTNVQHINAQEVNLQTGPTAQQMFDNIKALCKRDNIDAAEKLAEEMEVKFPSDYLVDEANVVITFAWALNAFDRSLKGKHASGEDFFYAMTSTSNFSGIPGQIRHINESLTKLQKANPEVAKPYWDEYAKVINQIFELWCGVKFTGGIPEIKTVLLNGDIHRATYNESYNYNRLIEALDKVSNMPWCGDADEEYLVWVILEIEKHCKEREKDNFGTYRRPLDGRTISLKPLINRLSPEGLQALEIGHKKRKAEEEAARIEAERKKLHSQWKDVIIYLKNKQYKEAFNVLQYMSGAVVDEEKAKFKKGLLGVKYIGDVNALNVDDLVERSLTDAGIKKP